jgi:CDP-paratose 2-epimerase
MSVAIVTGASGLVGSETVRFLEAQGLDVVGMDNNMRRYFFGADGDVSWKTRELVATLRRYRHTDIDVRDAAAVDGLFAELGRDISLVVHCAAQPSHDWAAREPATDFAVNAVGTLNVLEATRRNAPEATFIFTSTNKVYGDAPNALPIVERATRWELDPAHAWSEHGIDETMSIDQSTHSVFGASKVAADVMVQEYGRYFGMRTGVFRGGCLTGPAHSPAELHGFLGYLVKCAVTDRAYTVFGYKGKQVRDNIHAHDLVSAFWAFAQRPSAGAVYNIGGSRHSNCSILEAIALVERLSGRTMRYSFSDDARTGDHIWWITDVRRFRRDYPEWEYRHTLESTVAEMVDAATADAVRVSV